MNCNVIDNSNLIFFGVHSHLIVEKFPIRLDGRGLKDGWQEVKLGYPLESVSVEQFFENTDLEYCPEDTELEWYLGEKENLKTLLSMRDSAAIGNIADGVENLNINYPFEGGSVEQFFEDADLEYGLEDTKLEAHLRENENVKPPPSKKESVKNFLRTILKIIIRSDTLSFLIYIALTSIMLSILNSLKNALYTQPIAAYAFLRSTV